MSNPHTAKRSNPALPTPSANDLPEVAENDKMLICNILYAFWSLQECGQTPVSWNVTTKSTGYIVSVSFGPNFSLSLVDLQIIKDLSVFRIDGVFVRSSVKSDSNDTMTGCQVVVKVLNEQQKVSITEAEIVRIRKKKRSWFDL